MRIAVATSLLVLCVVLAWITTLANAQPAKTVSVTMTIAEVHEGFDMSTHLMLLWNRDITARPIGHALKSCAIADELLQCSLVLVLPLGKVTASGIVHSLNRYTLVITGGTGEYEGAQGPLFVRRVSGDGVRRLTFSV